MKVRASGDSVTAQEMRDGIAAIQEQQELSPAFPDAVEKAAAEASANPRLPELDRTDIELVTIDPDGARDLDQAMHIEREQERKFLLMPYMSILLTVKKELRKEF